MALSGSVTATGGYKGKLVMLEWSASQNIANNTSTISWTLKGTGGSGWHEAGNFKVIIDGDTVYNNDPNPKLQLWSGTVVASGSKTITHNADGTRSFSVSFECGIYYYAVNTRGSGSFTLDTIPRASTISLSASSPYIGNAITVNVSRASSSFTHTITWAFGNASGTIGTGVGTSVNWTLPTSLYAQIPNSASGVGTITCYTYSGGTHIGTHAVTFTALVPNTQAPTATISGARTGQTTINCYVAGKNGITLTATATPKASSSIKTIAFYDGSTLLQSGTSTTCNVGTLTAGTHTFKVIVTDSRGFNGQNTLSVVVEAYSPPVVTNITAYRTLNGASDTNRNNAGTYILANAEFSFSSCNGLNSLSVKKIQYKITSSASWSDFVTDITTKTNYWVGNCAVANDYEIRVVLTDKFNTIYSSVVTVFGSYKLISFNGAKGGVAFGQVCTDEKFTVNMPAVFKKPAAFKKNVILTGDASLSKSSTGAWFEGRDQAVVKQTSSGGGGFNPVASVKTKTGDWSIGNHGVNDLLAFSFVTDTDHDAGNNVNKRCYLDAPLYNDSFLATAKDYYDPVNEWCYFVISPGCKVARRKFTWTGTIHVPWGSLYESESINLGKLPPNFFTATPMIFLNLETNFGMLEGINGTSTTYVGNTFICRAGGALTSPYTFTIHILAVSLGN